MRVILLLASIEDPENCESRVKSARARTKRLRYERCQLDAYQDAGRLDQGIPCALPRGSGRVKDMTQAPGALG